MIGRINMLSFVQLWILYTVKPNLSLAHVVLVGRRIGRIVHIASTQRAQTPKSLYNFDIYGVTMKFVYVIS